MINEERIRLFLSLAETLNFTETANRMFISQQAVSKHISQLEKDLGFKLFIRSTHSVALTAAGERCQSFFGDELNRRTAFIEEERKEQLRRSKALRIGYNNWLDFGNPISSTSVRFSGLYPDITLIPERQPPDVLQKKLRSSELDIMLILKRLILNSNHFRIVELTNFPISVIIKKDLLPDAGATSLRELSDFPILINSFASEISSETTSRAKREMAQCGLTNKEIIICPNRDSVYTAVETGVGISISCSVSQVPNTIAAIPTRAYDTLACVCMDTNERKLVKRYMSILREEYM